ncbi:MAG: hypothetical protein CMQ29_11205 [Gammaproteobacteria bacterium]|nr:hypothetical protein [Gammaproteobacteria bacterium]
MASGVEIDLNVVGSGAADGGVPGGRALMAFVDAAMTRDPALTGQARTDLADALGEAATVDAAAVAAMFQLNTRAADAAGIFVEEPMRNSRSALGAQLGFGARADGRAP